MKMKEFGPGGGGFSGAPLDLPLNILNVLSLNSLVCTYV